MIWEGLDGELYDEADYDIRQCADCGGDGCDACHGTGSTATLRALDEEQAK